MSNYEIMKAAIEKAIANGWGVDDPEFALAEMMSGQFGHDEYSIYDHAFAKALWGEAKEYSTSAWEWDGEGNQVEGGFNDGWIIPAWQFHLQQMVISNDPIKYLGEHLGANITR